MNAISDCFACEEKEVGLDDGEAQTTLNGIVLDVLLLAVNAYEPGRFCLCM
jgi:hypothetical protein